MTHGKTGPCYERCRGRLSRGAGGKRIGTRAMHRTARRAALMAAILTFLPPVGPLAAQEVRSPGTYANLPTETPAEFQSGRDAFDHVKRDVMIPMRDGVRLHTVILVPKDARDAPILLTRTPYDADRLTSHAASAHLGPVLNGYDNPLEVIVEGGYIRVVQDVRGKHGSEGDYVVNRPLRGPQNPTPVDHATDTWDTIDWLVKNVPESNGRVGILGISYNGFLTLMALVDPHPALKVAVPMNPMVDGWVGDDWFHYGAFRQFGMTWIHDQVATRKSLEKWWTSHHDVYDTYMEAGSAGELGRRRGMEQLGFWRKLLEHPTYDAYLARAGGGQGAGGAASENPGDAGPRPVGPGGYLRCSGRLQGDRTQRPGQRQGLSGHGALVAWPADRGGQQPGRVEIQQRHGAALPPRDPPPVPRPIPQTRRAPGRHRTRHRVPDRNKPLAAATRLARG